MNNSRRNKNNFSREFTESLKKILLNEKKEKPYDKEGGSNVKKWYYKNY